MSEEAVATPDNTPQVDEVSDDVGTSEVSPETTTDSTEELKLDDIPERLRNDLKPHIDKINKQLKGTYTKKFQELSQKEKQWVAQQEAVSQQYETLRQTALDVLRDPSKLDAYRKIYAQQLGVDPVAQATPPPIQTVEDLTNYVRNEIGAVAKNLEHRIAGQAYQTIHQTQSVQRWETALDKMKATEPRFAKYEQLVATMIKSDPSLKASYTGQNEYEVLNKAYSSLKGMIREELDTVKQQTLSSVKAKKSSTTFTPTKPVGVESPPRQLSVEEMIARVNQRVGK